MARRGGLGTNLDALMWSFSKTDFLATAMCLDNKRLGKQRVECLQILNALTDPLVKSRSSFARLGQFLSLILAV